jgi:hypothetical protein
MRGDSGKWSRSIVSVNSSISAARSVVKVKGHGGQCHQYRH